MSDKDYESAATPNNNADNSNLQPMGVYEAAATPVQQRPESAPKIAKLTAEDYASIIEAPLTGEEVALKIAKLNEAGIDIDSNTINIEEFKAYDEWRKKQHFNFWGAVGDGIAQTGKDLGKGVVSAATDWKKLALASGLSAVATPAVGFSVAYGMTALEGFWRGTRDLGGLFVMAANHPSSPLYRMFINPSGDVNQSYQDFLDLSKWNAQSEKIISGKTNSLMPDRETYEKLFGKAFGEQVDDFIGVNKELATAASYVLDPTVFFTFGASSGAKAGAKAIANKAAAAAIKSGQANGHLAGSVAARAARNTMKATYLNSLGSGMVKFSQSVTEPLEKGYEWITKNIERITGGAHITATGQTRYRRFSPSSGHGPSSFTHATMGALGAYSLFSIPYAVPVASVYGGLKAIGYAGEALAAAGTKKTLTAGAATVAKGLEMSTPVALYFKDLAKTTAHGSIYGGLIGGFAGGEEGAAGGIGTGMALGAIGHNVALASGTISGKFAKMDQIKKFEDTIKVYEEKGHILKAKNMKKFVDDIRMSYGDDEAVRAMGHLLGLEGGKNTTVAYFTPEDMKNAWMSDPDYWVEVDDGNGGKKKVLTELGEEIKRNADRGGRAWNGLFMEIDPKTGKSIETPILKYKDKKTGRYHVIINTEAMKFSRNPDGTLRYRTVTEMVKTQVERTRDKGSRTESYQYDETVEGPRPRGAWDDPTVPRDEAGKPLEPEAAVTEDVNVGDDFTPAERVIDSEDQRRVYAEKSLYGQFKNEEVAGVIDKDGNIIEANQSDIIKNNFRKLTPEQRKEVVEAHNKRARAYKEIQKRISDTEVKIRKDATSKQKDTSSLSKESAEQSKKIAEIEQKEKEVTEKYKNTSDSNKEEKLKLRDELVKLNKEKNDALLARRKAELEMVEYGKQYEAEVKKQIDEATASDRDIIGRGEESLEAKSEIENLKGMTVEQRREHYEAIVDKYTKDGKLTARGERIIKAIDERLKADGFMSKDGKFESTKKQTAPAPAPVTRGKDIPARKQRVRSVELQGPARPLTIRRTGERQIPLGTEKYFEEGPTLPLKRQIPIMERVNSQALSELYHIMNRVRRRVEHGTEIDGVIRNWLFGDKEGVYSGAFNRDRKKITEFMVEAYNRIVGPRAGSADAVEWKKTISEYEKTGKIDEATSEAFEKFIEEVGESLFIGWESGKPFDFILKGGDLGTVRNFVEALKDTWANHIERTAVNLGADINTKQAFFDWFKKNKAGGKFRFDPYIEQAFTDLVRVYADKGMKNNGRSYANIYTMPPAAVKDHIEQYQLEEYVTKDKDGNFKLKPLDQVHRERHEAGLKMADELAELAQNDPAALNGLDFIVFDDYYGVESPKIEGGIAEGFEALEKDSKSAFDPNTLQSKDTMAFRGGVLFSSGDMADVGPSLDDIVKAQVAKSRKDGIYKDRGFETFGARGRPRTTPTAKMALTMKQALARGKTLVFRGIPTEKAFAIIEKYVPKSVSKNVRAIAPVIADGGHTSSNVMRSTYLGFEQSQADGTILYREMGHQFNAREVNYVPYDMEFRITLRNPKNPQINYKQPHFAFLTRIFDMDALNNRTHRLWNESPELRNAYNNIDEFITDVHSTIDEYSGSGMIPAVKFFGADEYAREKRMFVMAAIGASPSNRVKSEYGHSVYTVAEADWHELQHKNKMGANMHPWKSLRLDNMRDIASIPDESMHVRVSQQQYRRSQVPTPTTDESSLYDASYSAPDGPIELIVENLRDYHETSGTGEYNHVNVIKGLNDPLKLVKRLQKAPESNFETPKAMFNSADTFGGVDPEEIKFLKSNYQWAVSQGDIFLAESMKRYMAQFGKDAILIRHTLEEHLNAGGTIEEYNKEIKTGVPVVFPVQHGTGSEAFLRDPVFKPEFLGKTTKAASAKMGYFFAGIQETANSYSYMARFEPFMGYASGQIAIDILRNSYIKNRIADSIRELARKGLTAEQVRGEIMRRINNNKPVVNDASVKEVYYNGLDSDVGRDGTSLKKNAKAVEQMLQDVYFASYLDTSYIDTEVRMRELKVDDGNIEMALMEGGLDFDSLLDSFGHIGEIASDPLIRQEAWSFIDENWNQNEEMRDGGEPISSEHFSAYWNNEIKKRKLEYREERLTERRLIDLRNSINQIAHPEVKAHRMMRSFVGFKNPYVYDFKGQGRSAGPRFSEIYRTALENGHDGIILQNIHDRGPNDNIVSIAIGKENQIAVTDTSLSDTPAPRNSGYKEGGKYLHSAGDVLPEGAFGPNNPETVALSRSFKKSRGFNADDGDFIVKLNIDKSFKVGMAYEQMKHDPFNPKVREAYQQFAKETLEQFQHIIEAGYRPQMHQFESEPYSSSRQAIASLRDTKTLKVLSTDLNFGQRKVTEADIKENPLLAMTKYTDINGVPMRVNDIFRFVHDFFGHSERGNSFGPLGEENAWDVHARMYSPLARRAMTAGTRGQNSWVNFVHGENIEINRKRDMARRLEREGKIAEAAEIRKTIPKTTFAQQKIGLLPEWVSKFDDQLTPIEREMYGTHQVRKTSKGSFSAGDNVEHVWSPDPEEFAIFGAEARASSKFGTSVEIKNPEDYRGYELFMIGEGRAMASISPDGELGSVLKGINGTSDDVVRVIETALASGKVRWLNAFDTVLPSMYQKYGFEAVARLKFVDEYRPDGWDYELYNKFNGGRPDVVFMAYVGPEATSYKFFKGVEVATYDDAVALTHARVEEGKGMFSASDLYDFEDFTDQTKDNIELVKMIPAYADTVRILKKKVELGELTQAQMNFQLNDWHKKNKTGNTAKSWETFNVGGEKVDIADMTTMKVQELIAEVKQRDPNYKKFAARAMKAEADRAFAEAKAVEEQLQTELDASKEAPEGETRLQMIKRIRRTKTLSSGLTMLQRVREWNDKMDVDTAEQIARGLDKEFDKRQAEKEELQKRVDLMKKLRERRVDKILLRYAEENEAAQMAGEDIPHKGDDDVLRKKATSEAEADELTLDFDEDLARQEIEEKKLSKEEYAKINKDIRQQTRGGETLVRDESGELKAVYDQEIDEDMYEALLEDGVEEPKAWKAARNSFLEKTNADLKPITLEEAIAEIRVENLEHAKENDGEVLWSPDEVEKEAMSRVNTRQMIIDATNGVKEVEPFANVRKGTYEYMAKVQFANTEYYDGEGNSIMWKGDKSGKIYKGLKVNEKDKSNKSTGNVLIGGELVEEGVSPVYPPEQEAQINQINQRVRDMLDGVATGRGEYKDKLLTVLDLFRLWGYEVNKNLFDNTFVARRSLIREEGLKGQALTREVFEARGDLITAYDVEAVWTERLDAMPDLYNTITELLKDIYAGAEFSKKQALDIWIDGMTRRGKRPTDAEIKAKEEFFKNADSDIEISELLVDKFIRDFMKEGNYALSAEDLVTESNADPEKYFKQNVKNARKAGRDKLLRRIAREEGKKRELTPEERANVDAESEAKLRSEAKEGMLSFPTKFFGPEDSLEALIFTKLWKRNEEIKAAFKKMTGPERRKDRRQFRTSEGLRAEAISQAKNIRYKFIQYLFNSTNPIIFEIAAEHAEKSGMIEKTPEGVKKDPKQVEAERRAILAEEAAKVHEQTAPVAQTPIEPVVPKPTTATPATPTYKDSPAQREKDRNKEALAAAIAKAEKEGKATPVTGIRALAAAIGGQPSQPKPSAPKQTPQQLGYSMSPDNLRASHPSGRFSIEKRNGIYEVTEFTTRDGVKNMNKRGVFKSFADAHKFIEEKITAQTPPPAPVGRPATPKTPEPVKKAIEAKEKQQIETNTAKPPAEVGKAQAVVVNQGLAALDPVNSNAVAQVLQIDDNLTLKTDQLTNKTATTADKRYTATRTRTGIRVVMNAHIDPVTKQQVKGKKIGDVQTAEQAQLLIREFDFKQRRLLEQQGVDVAGQLQAQNPVLTPAQVTEVTKTAVTQAQSQPPVPPVATPQSKAETHPMFTTAIAALSTMGVSKTEAKDRVKKAIEEIGFNADLQAILKHAFTQGAPAAQRIANSNATHAATVQATGNAPVTPQAAATVVIMPTVAGTQSATGGSVPPAPNIGVPPVIKTPPATAPALSAQRLSYVDTACRFIPRKSMYILSSGVQAEGVTYTNALGYMIVQSGISKWRAFNPAAALISVTDNEQEAVDAILREVFKR